MPTLATFNIGTSTGDLTITGVGHQPRAMKLIWGGSSSTESVQERGNAMIGQGFFAGTTEQFACVMASLDANTASVEKRAQSSTTAVLLVATSSSAQSMTRHEISAVSDDGFTITRESVPAVDAAIHFISWSADEIASVKAGEWSPEETSTHVQDIETGFRPTFLNTMSVNTTAFDALQSTGMFWTGAASAPTTDAQILVGIGAEDIQAVADTFSVYAQGVVALTQIVPDQTALRFGKLDRWLGDGFRIEWTEDPNSTDFRVAYLAMEKVLANVQNTTNIDDTATELDILSGFQPESGAMLAAANGQLSTALQTNAAITLGLFHTAAQKRAVSYRNTDNQADTVVTRGIDYQRPYAMLGNGALDEAYDVNELYSDGARLLADTDNNQQEPAIILLAPSSAQPPTGSFRWRGSTALAAGATLSITPPSTEDWMLIDVGSDQWTGSSENRTPDLTIKMEDSDVQRSGATRRYERPVVPIPTGETLKIVNDSASTANVKAAFLRVR